MVRLLSICLYMREIDSVCWGYLSSFGTKIDIWCEPLKKKLKWACAVNEATPACVYMKENSLAKPIYRLTQGLYIGSQK